MSCDGGPRVCSLFGRSGDEEQGEVRLEGFRSDGAWGTGGLWLPAGEKCASRVGSLCLVSPYSPPRK